MNHILLISDNESDESLFKLIGEKLEARGLSCESRKSEHLSVGDDVACIILSFLSHNLQEFSGLELTRNIRRCPENADRFHIPILYLVPFSVLIPHFHNPHKLEFQVLKNLLGNPKFEDVNKATFFGEVLFENLKKGTDNLTSPERYPSLKPDSEDGHGFVDVINVCALSFDNGFFERLIKTLGQIKEYRRKEWGKLRKKFYDTFVNFHEFEVEDESFPIADIKIGNADQLQPDSKTEGFSEAISKNRLFSAIKDLNIRDVLEFADHVHRLLEGIDIEESKGGHHLPLELFGTPPPFPIQGLFDAIKEISHPYTDGMRSEANTKINLLLMDNRSDKLAVESPQGLLGTLFHEPYEHIFDLSFNDCKSKIDINNVSSLSIDDMKKHQFDFLSFLNGKDRLMMKRSNEKPDDIDNNCESKRSKHKSFDEASDDIEYCESIYSTVQKAHFVLLDFFLNSESTYLAFDFIRDINEIMKYKQETFTTWYFITSSVYDSVVKFYQSGLIAEYYESAVVSSGDDPTNKRRQIIFLYKLMTFIQSRMRSFKRFHDSVVDSKILNCKRCTLLSTDCLIGNQNLFRKYLAEYEEIIRIFPGQEAQEEEFKKTVELLESTINQFLWLPEADWPMIQRQIDHINRRLRNTSDLQFKCQYLLGELQKRSEIY